MQSNGNHGSQDAIYYRDAGSVTGVRSASILARLEIYKTFIEELRPQPQSRILDLGVSIAEASEANMLEKQYPWPENITCAGVGDGEVLVATYPGVSYVKIRPGDRLPFADSEFDIVHSNAVLEHVGGRDERANFLREAARVGKSIFIAIPNRWFPLEHHTAVPLLHWHPGLFRALIRRTRLEYWANPRNLEFLSAHRLLREWRALTLGNAKVVYTGLRLGPLSSNLALILKRS